MGQAAQPRLADAFAKLSFLPFWQDNITLIGAAIVMARSNVSALLLLWLFASHRFATAECFYRDGSSASANFVQCPGVNFCCQDVEYCETNGLCRDNRNNANGSTTYLPGKADPGPYNYTGLYSTPTCNNTDFVGCDEECTAGTSMLAANPSGKILGGR
ncbi:hypothetical protein LTR36_004511 [Oleoguttula mirabilis]|uniref:Uncharacterized protein n=1 Tax=Oleoguttula mirabilis TaxID=1507867 RepID=A0AAV9JFD4_9PEZI|nr:hypothetical protein LTR36_004511 [Oleoguttula mirabilis]